jgi:hypothetical protein
MYAAAARLEQAADRYLADLKRRRIQIVQENKMPQTTHDRAAELHNLAAHAHSAAATEHGKGDHLTAHELSKQAFEHSRNAHRHTEEMVSEKAQSEKK